MPDISVTYEGNEITNMSASGTKTLLTDGKYCTDDITITYVRPSGGGTVEEKDVNFIDYDGTLLYSYTAAEFADLASMPANPSHTGLTAQGWNWSLADAKTFVANHGGLVIGQNCVTSDGKTYFDIELPVGRLSPYFSFAVNGTIDVDWGDGSAHSTITGTSLSTAINTQHNYSAAGAYTIAISVTTGEFSCSGGSYWGVINCAVNTLERNNVYGNMLKAVRLGTNVRLDNRAFRYSAITAINIPSGLVFNTGGSSFYDCHFLNAIVIPDGTDTIQYGLFSYCTLLRYASLPKSITLIKEYSFRECRALRCIYIPDGVTKMNQYVFAYCYGLTTIKLPSGMTSIGTYAFTECQGLVDIDLPDDLTSITSSMIQRCYCLTGLTIKANVTSIAAGAFNNCQGVKEIHFKPSSPPAVANSNAFTYMASDITIYVPTGKLNDYKTASNYPDPNTYTYVEE